MGIERWMVYGISTGAMVLSLGSAALAQPIQDAANGEASEIVVTAQKRSESISRVPISISAQNQEQLDKQGIKSIGDLARTVPGLTLREGGLFDSVISVRGISSNVGASTTGVYIDETPIQSRQLCFYCGFTAFPKLFDLERVEVLRGPQGTLFGAGSEGGTVRFITPKPGLNEYTGYARAEVATTRYGAPSFEIGGAVGGPLVEGKLGFRGSLWTRTDGGYIDRYNLYTNGLVKKDVNQQKSYVGRLALTWKPVEELEITPSYFFQKDHADSRNLYWPSAGGKFRSYVTVKDPSTDRQSTSALDIAYDFGGATLRSVTSYFDRRQNRLDEYTFVDFAFYGGGITSLPQLPSFTDTSVVRTTQKNFTQELRLTTDWDGPLNLTAGLYFADGKTNFHQHYRTDYDAFLLALYGLTTEQFFGYPLIDPENTPYLDRTRQRDREYAAFGELSYKITDDLKLALGGRIARNRFVLDIDRDGAQNFGRTVLQRRGSETPFTPRASLSYQMDRTLLYTTVAKGYRVGGGNSTVAGVSLCDADLAGLGLTDLPPTYKSDHVWSYEAGVKTRLAGGKVQVSGSAFWIDWKNIQSNILLPTCGYNYTGNTGSARSRGFDLQLNATPVDGLTLNGTLGFVDATYRENVTVNGVFLIHSGSPLPTPKWTATVGAEYEFPASSSVNAYLRGDYQYSSGYTSGFAPGDLSYDPVTNPIDAINLVSLRVGARFGGGDLSLFANNLFDSRPVLNRFREINGYPLVRNVTVRPRTIGAALTYRY